MTQAVKDALYIAIVIVLAIVFFRIIWKFGALFLIIAVGYYVYKRFVKNEGGDIFKF